MDKSYSNRVAIAYVTDNGIKQTLFMVTGEADVFF